VKKKIAVFANGLNSENLMKYMEGIKEACEENFADFHVFLSHDFPGNNETLNKSEWCIFSLPDMRDYDAAILYGPGMNFDEVNEQIIRRCREADIPIISISSKYDDAIRIYTDNYKGMKLVANHLLDEHNVRDVVFIAGPADNEESNERLRAIRDAFRERNLSFGAENVFYSNWLVYLATDFVKNRYYSEDGLPEAIICANDTIAYFVCFILDDMGVKCPEDVLVTGFDGDSQAMNFYPSITTAVQPFYEMGSKTIECIKRILAGESLEQGYYIPCTFRIAESCGCNTSECYNDYRKQGSIQSYKKSVNNELSLYRIKGLTDAVLQSESYSTIDAYLQGFFYESDGVEGNPFYICMDPEFARLSELETDNLPEFKYGSHFIMLVGKNGDNKYNTTQYDLADGLIPYEKTDEVNHIYVFQPIYYQSFAGGYMIMADNLQYFGDKKYEFMHSHFNRILDQYKKNMQLTNLNNKLSMLMNTDALTSTKNRMAFETYKQELSKKMKQEQIRDVAFIVADINNLKKVNDNLGHECGDEYIKNASTFICRTFKHSPVFRIGGDEFFVALTGEDYERRYELVNTMSDTMGKLCSSEQDPVKRISVAFGLADYDADMDEGIDDTIKRADNEMYQNKREQKKSGNETV